MMPHLVLATNNDNNGNPRRCSLIVEDCEILAVKDHGYEGVPVKEWGVPALTLNVSVTEYKRWINSKKVVTKCELYP